MRWLLRLFLITLVAACFAGILSASGEAPAQELHLGVLHVNDTHGHLLPFKVNGEDGWGGFARLGAMLERARSDTRYQWITLHAGDAFQGTPLSNLLTGAVDIECMNRMGFDAMCLGNHEFDFGCDLLEGRMSDAQFPLLSANLVDKRLGASFALPYTILERDGCQVGVVGLSEFGHFKVGVLGLITKDLLNEATPEAAERVSVLDPVAVARRYAAQLRSAGCDIVIALTHQGIDADVVLAQQVPELDLVVGGHSHTFITAPLEVDAGGRKVLVTQDGCFAQNLGVLRLDFTRASPRERFSLKGYSEDFVPLKPAEPEDKQLAAYIESFNKDLEQELARVVCTASGDLPVDNARRGENALADLVLDALREVTGADAVLLNSGNFRTGLKAGQVTYGMLYEALPYDNFLVKLTLSGAQLRELLAYAGTQYGKGGAPQVSGLRVRYVDGRLAEASLGGAPLDDARSYTVLTTSYVASGGDGYPLKEDLYGPGYTGRELRTAFAAWAEQRGTISGALDGRLAFEWEQQAPPGPES